MLFVYVMQKGYLYYSSSTNTCLDRENMLQFLSSSSVWVPLNKRSMSSVIVRVRVFLKANNVGDIDV